MEQEQSQPSTDKRKQSLYFPADMFEEIRLEADRMGTSLSQVVQSAWRAAKERIQAMPGEDD
jgi:uncharacterized small protein (TIGR04563 family)